MVQADYRTGTKASTFEFIDVLSRSNSRTSRAMEFAKIFGLEIPPPRV